MNQRVPLMGLEPTTSTLRYRRATHCAMHDQDEMSEEPGNAQKFSL